MGKRILHCRSKKSPMNETAPASTEPLETNDSMPTLRSYWKSLLATGIFAGMAIAAQYRDMLNDRSVSNLTTLICAALAVLFLLSIVLRIVAKKNSTLVATVIAVFIVAVPATLIRVRGFNGEMIPALEFRFRSEAKLQEAIAEAATRPQSAIMATTSFPQFLGPDRNAVIPNREFAIPETTAAEELWRIAIGDGWAGFAIQDQYCVTLEQRGDEECVTAYQLSDGKLLWIHKENARHQNPLGGIGPRSTPTIRGEFVYTQGATGIVLCLNLATGEVVWRQELLKLAGWEQSASESAISWGRAASPLLIDDLCIVPFGRPLNSEPTVENLSGRSLMALDAATGEVRWTHGEDQISYASPVLMTFADLPQIVTVNESSVTSHNVADGAVLWSLDWAGQSNGSANCSSALPVGNDGFLLAKGYGIGSGVFTVSKSSDDAWSVEEKWASHRVLKTKFTHACVDGDVAYALSDGTLECVDLTNGKRWWAQSRSTRYGHGHVILVGDCLVVQAEAGPVAFVAASTDEFKSLGTIDAMRSKTWNVPSIAGRYLAVRNDLEAVLYRLPAK